MSGGRLLDERWGIFSRRERGATATPDEWATRDRPQPLTRMAFAALEDSESFGRRWKAWRKHRADADGVLDRFHILEQMTTASQS